MIQIFFNNPLESRLKTYEAIQLDYFQYCENAMRSFVEFKKSFVRLKHEPHAGNRKMVSEKFEPFIKYWNYPNYKPLNSPPKYE